MPPVLQLLQAMSKIDELNYPERANAYYLVNVPYVFSAIWKVSFRTEQFRSNTNIRSIGVVSRSSARGEAGSWPCCAPVSPELEPTVAHSRVIQSASRHELTRVLCTSTTSPRETNDRYLQQGS